ncbi:zinc finger protein 239-like isoform X1 [Trematomus bernacchii]|uniref:zinc finger protein 239-like isoform X1 n=1 Tax=Trematomus bernacchii TaxID=40690 RepID=UPI001469F9B1|nr:zinc finger protein 239-like isoform X1 [Trematomus bernacchii]
MSTSVEFHSQIASIMEVLANAAVAEICKVVDDGYTVVHLQMSRSQKDNEFMRRKLKLMELQVARYRAERVRGAEGFTGGRFPGVRPLHRQSRDSLAAGPMLQARTRFLNRDPATQQSSRKIQPINLDQDPDQEVVTTTKAESAESEEEEGLLIVKVEETMETGTPHHEAADIRGDANPATSPPGPPMDARCHREKEGQRHLENSSSAQCKDEETHEEQGLTPEKHSPSQTLLGWQESSETEDRQRPSCSTNTAGTVAQDSSFSHVSTNMASSFSTASKRPRSDMDQANTVMKSPFPGAEDRRSSLLLSQSMNYEPSSEDMFGGKAAYSLSDLNTPLAAMDSQQQHIQHPWSGVRTMDNFSSPNHLHQASGNQNQETGSAPPDLPYACTFCTRRYAHQCQLRIHERVHTGDKPFRCVQCGKSFGQVCSLKRHQMVHTGERPFPCPHCGKQFSTSTNLKVHQSVHTGEKRFHCSKCGKNFSFLSNLIRHQALHSAK